MARVNWDDEIYGDRRFRKLEKKLGEDAACGMLIRFWRNAQKHWGDYELMPLEIFQEEGLEPLLEVGLAVMKNEGVEARGSKERFAWYRQKCDAGNARKDAPRDSKGRIMPNPAESNPAPAESGAGGLLENGVTVTPNPSGSDSGGQSSSGNESRSSESPASSLLCSSLLLSAPLCSPLNPKKETKPELVGQLKQCLKTWAETQLCLGMAPGIQEHEKQIIVRALQKHGDAETVDLALYGARHQPKSPGWDPKAWTTVSRILERDPKSGVERIADFVTWGRNGKAAEVEKKARLEATERSIAAARRSPMDDIEAPADPEQLAKIRGIISGRFGELPGASA